MSSSREDSPDWLRSFQAPTHSPLTLSSGSDENSSYKASPSSDYRFGSQSFVRDGTDDGDDDVALVDTKKISEVRDTKKGQRVDGASPKKRKKRTEGDGREGNIAEEETSEKHMASRAMNHSIWALSSDSESCPDDEIILKRGTKEHQVAETGDNEEAVLVGSNAKSPSKKASIKKSPKKRPKAEEHTPKKEKNTIEDIQTKVDTEAHDDTEVQEDTSEKHIGSRVSTSRLPLVLSDKVQRSKALVECEGESIDLSGDMGSVGRIIVSDAPSGDHELYFDLKGTIYRTSIIPSRTFCVVSFGQSEAKIEAIMNDFIQLKPQSNVYEAETMVEGTLEGFSFDSEDEAEKMVKAASHQNDHNKHMEEKVNGKRRGKAENSSGVTQKKGKTGGGKAQPAKKVRKKPQMSKKTKTKK